MRHRGSHSSGSGEDGSDDGSAWESYNDGASNRRLRPFAKLKPTRSNIVHLAQTCMPAAQVCLGCNVSGGIFLVRRARRRAGIRCAASLAGARAALRRTPLASARRASHSAGARDLC